MTTYNINNLDKWAKKLEINLETLVRHTAMNALEGVTAKSPVDTGRFKASWNVAQGAPDLSVKPEGEHSVAPQGQKTEAPVLAPSNDPYIKRYVTNNLEYGPRLEDGYSGQAPNGMVKLTALEIKAFMKAEARRLKEE